MDIKAEEQHLINLANGNQKLIDRVRSAFASLNDERLYHQVTTEIRNIEADAILIAKKLAEVAHEIQPLNKYFMDQYGWLLIRCNQSEFADKVLSEYLKAGGEFDLHKKSLQARIYLSLV